MPLVNGRHVPARVLAIQQRRAEREAAEAESRRRAGEDADRMDAQAARLADLLDIDPKAAEDVYDIMTDAVVLVTEP